jgi:hypothetical protein
VLRFTKQSAVRYRAGEAPVQMEIEIADTYQEGQRVDGEGNNLPYVPGLYIRNWRARRLSPWDQSFHFKTFLTPLRMHSPSRLPTLF